jgi:hypothetical protein
MASFRTKARAIDLLGKNQIADLPTAITELWKNGYDAYGDYLEAAIYQKGYDGMPFNVFTISDDGHGMNRNDLENKWIVIGTDSKKNSTNKVPIEDRFGKDERVSLGEKGIGRLSVTYLGSHMLMITKKQKCPYEIVFMNWKILDNYELYLDQVIIPMETIYDLVELPEIYNKLQVEFKNNLTVDSWGSFNSEKLEIENDLRLYNNIPEVVIKAIKKHFERVKHGT